MIAVIWVGIPISSYKHLKCIWLQVYYFEIDAPSYQIDVALSNGVGFQPIRIVVLLLFHNLVRCQGG